MCWSAQVSLNTYIFSTFACLFGYFNQVINLSELLFLQSFMAMQLFEYFVWAGKIDNRKLSMVGLLIILSQPFFSIVGMNDKKYILGFLAAYVVFLVILLTMIKPWSQIVFKTIPASNGHLAWHWLDLPWYAIVIWVFFLIIKHILNKNLIYFAIVVFMVSTSYILFADTKAWGSMWCWYANAFAFILVTQVFWKDICMVKK
jgi:hypothetical protein